MRAHGQRKRARPAGDLLRVSIHCGALLARCALPAVKGGGLFVPTTADYELGDRVVLLVTLLENPMTPVMGRVVWVTPAGAVGHRQQGVGVQFDDDDNGRRLCQTLLELLASGRANAAARPHAF